MKDRRGGCSVGMMLDSGYMTYIQVSLSSFLAMKKERKRKNRT